MPQKRARRPPPGGGGVKERDILSDFLRGVNGDESEASDESE